MFIESHCIYHFTYNYSLPRALVKSISFINSVLFRRNEVWIECLETAEPDVAAVVAEDDQRPPPIFIDFKNVEAAEAAAEAGAGAVSGAGTGGWLTGMGHLS